MRLAIHHREGSFSNRWIEYCKEFGIEYIIVDCFQSNIIEVMYKEKITHFMWHFHHSNFHDLLLFSPVLNGIDLIGVKTFPNFSTRWHFDDKVSQKYLLESLQAPFAKSTVFYNEKEALKFIENTKLPVVAKLKRGAGAANVSLLGNAEEAKSYIQLMFGAGVSPIAKPLGNFSQKVRISKNFKNPLILIKKVFNHFKKVYKERALHASEKGYVYLQEFLPGNDYDTRIIIIGKRAFGMRRFNRENDFRASGSGKFDFSAANIDTRLVEIAFETTEKLKAQCLAYDFVYDGEEPKIIEVCFGFSRLIYDSCEGYWNRDLKFIEGPFISERFMIKDFLDS
ncbi:MAG TPA: hypothetical protein VKB19_05360 [Pedobacter sp.]|nr:hypothetical protein [Pedobacter sp.]